MPGTTTTSRFEPSAPSIHEEDIYHEESDLKRQDIALSEDERHATPEPAWSIPSSSLPVPITTSGICVTPSSYRQVCMHISLVKPLIKQSKIHKFSDDTLQQIDEALDYWVKEFKVNKNNQVLNTRFWTTNDVIKCKQFMFAIQKRLKLKRIFRNLESFVGGKNYAKDTKTSTENRMMTSSL
ncbi:hypothetical protein Tco_1228712 [Tanacetum coccineum]|uniref:PiggyBac transposable element-derived protein domain-containing protein n=1 Tax=Tanacetum coccineum TaxID=301880 RepID=A0ABQ5B134_9ASTR